MTLNDKKEIKLYLENEVKQKIEILKTQISNLTIDAQNDAKGSAGDKHETGLAMMHLEQEKLSKKLEQLLQQQQNLKTIITDVAHKIISLGSLVYTPQATFFVSEALPYFTFQNKTIFPLSTQAPIYIELKGKKVGDSLVFNGKTIKILAVI